MSERNGGTTVSRNDQDVLELRNLTGDNDKRTRFQVNRVRSESHNADKDGKESTGVHSEDDHTDDDDLHSVTDKTRLNSEYAKSFRFHLQISKDTGFRNFGLNSRFFTTKKENFHEEIQNFRLKGFGLLAAGAILKRMMQSVFQNSCG
ncbi:hypothetical protein GEV33_005046 [Tenebrio molitor]|uniref:Uncharacterized protein n=1 Tax=Tenebrio molitor TaxID=7067 RepID=A0A8J6LE34_TENMO|nr:hypothetical protein GEV33_005046 [Tenebrio molitor]